MWIKRANKNILVQCLSYTHWQVLLSILNYKISASIKTGKTDTQESKSQEIPKLKHYRNVASIIPYYYFFFGSNYCIRSDGTNEREVGVSYDLEGKITPL